MTIKIKCPVCNAGNKLLANDKNCRRCGEDLGLLYRIKGYSLSYRIYLAQSLAQAGQGDLQQKKGLAAQAAWLLAPAGSKK